MLEGARKGDSELDMDSAYERRLSLYSQGTVYHSAPATWTPASPMIERTARTARRMGTNQEPEVQEEDGLLAQILKWSALLLVLLAAWIKRHDLIEAFG